MASSASGQDEPNPALLLATRAGKKHFAESHIINPSLTKLSNGKLTVKEGPSGGGGGGFSLTVDG